MAKAKKLKKAAVNNSVFTGRLLNLIGTWIVMILIVAIMAGAGVALIMTIGKDGGMPQIIAIVATAFLAMIGKDLDSLFKIPQGDGKITFSRLKGAGEEKASILLRNHGGKSVSPHKATAHGLITKAGATAGKIFSCNGSMLQG